MFEFILDYRLQLSSHASSLPPPPSPSSFSPPFPSSVLKSSIHYSSPLRAIPILTPPRSTLSVYALSISTLYISEHHIALMCN